MMPRLSILLTLFSFCLLAGLNSQVGTEIVINNRSFEDIPRMGTNDARVSINGWYDCGTIRFKNESPPDIHPGKFWDVDLPASNGNTYIGMVVRDNDSWEGVSQRLEIPIKANKCYLFTIELAKSDKYISGSRLTQQTTNYVTPAVFRLWGGTGFCNDKELLAESKPIDHPFWKKYQFKIKPSSNIQYIMIEAFYKTPVFLPYCGHILVDNITNFKEIECDDVIKDIVESDLKPKTKTPPHKKSRVEQAKQKVEQVTPPVVQKPTESLLGTVDVKKLKEGSIIEIKNLYFQADTSKIDPGSYTVLDDVYNFLKTNTNLIVEIGGHTNGIPPPYYCDRLSEQRAKAVYLYLVDRGISSDKLSYRGYGKRHRIANDNSVEGRKKNQRVEIKVLSVS